MMRHLARSLMVQARSAQPIPRQRAERVLQVVAGLDGLAAPGFEPLTPLERAALEAAAHGATDDRIPLTLDVSPAEARLALRGGFVKLARYLDPTVDDDGEQDDGGIGAGDREPRRPPPGQYPPRTAQEPLRE